MTCIIGYISDYKNSEGYNKIFMGGDSCGSNSYDITIRKNKKVFIKNNMIFGFTSSYRMGQIIQYCFNIPYHEKDLNNYEYLCSIFIKELIKCFKDNGFLEKNENGRYNGGTFLLGYKGCLYQIQDDFNIAELTLNYHACGSGEDYAMGALNILNKKKLNPKEKIKNALTTAEKFSRLVSSPFDIIYL